MDTIKIHPADNVAVALKDLKKGDAIQKEPAPVTLLSDIPKGHKAALERIEKGAPVIKYGTRIGIATEDILPGEWVHTHNVKTALTERSDYTYRPAFSDLPKAEPIAETKAGGRTFSGYLRKDGKVGIRNELWIIPTVGCVNEVAKRLAEECRDLVSGSVDGIYAFPHPYGCSQTGEDHECTKRILADLIRHPNAGAVLVLSLGCENLTVSQLKEELGDYDRDRVGFLICQEEEDELSRGREILRSLAEYAASFQRREIPASELVIGLKCGGSDGLSGITANPVLGRVSDSLIAMGGSCILTEVPEMFGAEEMLLGRCKDEETFDRAVKMVKDFKKYFTDHGQVVYENPSPGNKAGGITTLEDKSCGCVQKGGSAKVSDVLSYGERVKEKGLSLLSGPGNDLVSATALAAAGAHMILFTTGRGTPFGAPVPTLKISSNSGLYQKKGNWIDLDTGSVAEGEENREEAAGRLLEKILLTASGEKTRQERNGYRGIAILKDGVTM